MENLISKYKNREGCGKISKVLSVSSQKISKWERNINNPNLNQSIIICEQLGITLDELYREKSNVLYFSHINDYFRKLIYETYSTFIFINEKRIVKYKNIISKNNSKIKFQRKRYGWSQKQLADKLGISRSLVRDWENNTATPSLEMIFDMADSFDVSLDYFVNDKGVDELNLNRLTDEQKIILNNLIDYFSLN